MATELYGVDARLVGSIARTPVSTETNIIFIGASASGTLNKPELITSLAEYQTKLGGVPGDGYNLSEAAVAAFTVANISKCWMIPVSNSTEFDAADYIGSAENETGVYAIEKLLRESPTMVNLLCAPSITDATVLSALNTIAQKAAGHWQSFIVYDVAQDEGQTDENGYVEVSDIVADKKLSSERARAVWGAMQTSGGYIVSGAAIQACLMAVSDADYGVPARCGGNLAVSGVKVVMNLGEMQELTNTCEIVSNHPRFTITEIGYTLYTGKAKCSYIYSIEVEENGETTTQEVTVEEVVSFESGVGAMAFSTAELVNPTEVDHIVKIQKIAPVELRESDATQLSADGICSWINYGGGNWHTWGDHTSAFAAGTVSDERARFDNYMRMQMMIANRFQYIYRFSIDDPMTLQMRNDVITEEQNYLNTLVSLGALIGSPKVEFVAAENPIDNIAQGYFTWSISTTEAPPLKYMLAKVAYTQAGLDVLTQEG